MPTTRVVSATVALGVIAGVITAVAILPLAMVALSEVSRLQYRGDVATAVTGANVAARRVALGQQLDERLADQLELQHLGRYSDAWEPLDPVSQPFPPESVQRACSSGIASVSFAGVPAIASCIRVREQLVVAVTAASNLPTARISLATLAFALIAGLVTALAVQRLLSPITLVAKALDRLSVGDRGVTVASTGFSELDDIIERLNLAAHAMVQREDAILARIRVVQELARLVAHEVRNPLQSIEFMTALIIDADDLAERQEVATSIQSEVRILDQVVQRILNEGASGGALRIQRELRPVQPILEQLVKLQSALLARDGIELVAGPLNEIAIPVDVMLFRRSIENLINNAAREVPKTGGRIELSCAAAEDALEVIVDDNGSGVPEQLRHSLFETHISGQGSSGLGLALARGVARAHGGYIRHERSPLGGARFIVGFPTEETAPRSTDASHSGGG